MTNPPGKRLTLLVAVIAVAIISVAMLAQFGGSTNSSGSTTTLSSLTNSRMGSSTAISTSTTASTQTKSTSASSVVGRTAGLLSFGQYYNDLIITPSATMNYTITIKPIDKEVSHVALSAVPTVPGVTAVLNPKEFTFLGSQEGVGLQISVDPNVSSPIVSIDIIGTTAKGVDNQTFAFSLEKEMVVVVQGTTNFAKPTTLHVNTGQTVKWFDTFDIDDDGNGYVTIVLTDGSAASPTLTRYDLWSHRFEKPGTYTYQVNVLGIGGSSGTVVVA